MKLTTHFHPVPRLRMSGAITPFPIMSLWCVYLYIYILKVFENRVLRRIFRPKMDEVTGEWRKIHNEQPNNLYSPNIFRVIKSRRMRWAVHVAHMGRAWAWAGSIWLRIWTGGGHL